MNIAYLASCVTPAVRERRAIRSYSPAGTRKALLLARVLQELGHRVTVLSSSYGYRRDEAFAEEQEGVSLLHNPARVWRGRCRPFKRTLAGWFNLCTLVRLRRQLDLVMIYNCEPEFAVPALLARAWLGLPLVLDFEDGIFLDRAYRGGWRRWLERSVYRRMSGAVLVNAGLLPRVQAEANAVPTVVIHGFLNRDWRVGAGGKPPPDTAQPLRLLCAGNLSADFGFAELQRYIDALPAEVTLIISGRIEGAEEAELRARVATRANVEFRGFVSAEEHERLLQQADGVILLHNPQSPYHTTNFPSKFFDYLSRGQRILSTRNPLFEPYAFLPNLLFVTLTRDGLSDLATRIRRVTCDAAALEKLDRAIVNDLGTFFAGIDRRRRGGPAR